MDFLDSLQPDDFRNGGTFNQSEKIIDELNEAFYNAALNKKNPTDFIKKAAHNLFRENSTAAEKLIKLSQTYLEMRMAAANKNFNL